MARLAEMIGMLVLIVIFFVGIYHLLTKNNSKPRRRK